MNYRKILPLILCVSLLSSCSSVGGENAKNTQTVQTVVPTKNSEKTNNDKKDVKELSKTLTSIVRKIEVPGSWEKDGIVHELESKIGDNTLIAYAQTWNIPNNRLLDKTELKKVLNKNKDIFDNVGHIRESKDNAVQGNEILTTITYKEKKFDLVLLSTSRGNQYKAEIALTHEGKYLEHIGEDKFKFS